MCPISGACSCGVYVELYMHRIAMQPNELWFFKLLLIDPSHILKFLTFLIDLFHEDSFQMNMGCKN